MTIKSAVVECVERYLDEPITATVETASFEESNPALDFVDAGLIDEEETATDWEIVTVFSENQLVAEVSVAFIPAGEIAYISDFEIGENYRGQGLGSTVHSSIVTELESMGVTDILEVPTNDVMEHIVCSDGFEKASENELSSWFRKTV